MDLTGEAALIREQLMGPVATVRECVCPRVGLNQCKHLQEPRMEWDSPWGTALCEVKALEGSLVLLAQTQCELCWVTTSFDFDSRPLLLSHEGWQWFSTGPLRLQPCSVGAVETNLTRVDSPDHTS